MKIPILLTRTAFREGVFARDENRCVFCPLPAEDAHHIIERRLWPDGGYYLDNGASVCRDHHIRCETTEISVERSEEHTSELQSLMRISYAVFCLKKKNKNNKHSL